MEELIELLHKIKFMQTTVCSCKRSNLKDWDICEKCVETYFTFDTKKNEQYKVYILDPKLDYVQFDVIRLDETVETETIFLKDIKKKFYNHPYIKPIITNSKIKSIMQMNEDILLEKYTEEFRKVLASIGFKLLDTGSNHSDIYIFNTDEIHYRVIVNNIDTDYSNSEKIEFEWFNKITNKRRGLNWHVQSSSVRQAIDKFFYYLPELKAYIRKNKIEKIVTHA